MKGHGGLQFSKLLTSAILFLIDDEYSFYMPSNDACLIGRSSGFLSNCAISFVISEQ
jgi:hypothetical protein